VNGVITRKFHLKGHEALAMLTNLPAAEAKKAFLNAFSKKKKNLLPPKIRALTIADTAIVANFLEGITAMVKNAT